MTAPPSVCPVPADQRPINEYKSLQDSWFFGWSGAALKTYLLRLSLWAGLSGFVAIPIAAASFAPAEAPGQFLLASAGGALLLVSLILLRLYLGWSYIYRRLQSETVDYEETGWYDGQSWTKPPTELVQDRLIGTYEVLPILQRLKYSFGCLGLLLIAGQGLWQWLATVA